MEETMKRFLSFLAIPLILLLMGCVMEDIEEFTEERPYVRSTIPRNLEANVSLNTTISIRFSEPVDTESAEAAFITSPLALGNFTWDPEGTEMTFKPDKSLSPSTEYTVTVQSTVRDKAGTQMADTYTFTFLTGEAEPEQPELEGYMEWIMEYPDEYEEFGGNRSKWTTYQVKKEEIELIFKPKKGTAKGVSILLELGEIDFTEANQTWAEREGRYQWRFTTLDEERAIRVTIMAPQLPAGLNESTYDVRMFYAYTNEDPVSMDNRTLTVKLLD